MSAMDDRTDKDEPPVAVRQHGRGPVVGVIQGTPRIAEQVVQFDEPHSETGRPQDDGETPAVAKRFLGDRRDVIPLLAGGFLGAIAAVVAVFLINMFQPPLDPRVVPMAGQLNGFVQQMYNLETSLRAVEVDVVRMIDTNGGTESRLTQQDEKIAAALSQLTAAQESLRVESGLGSPVFGVAVVQLATAIEAGRPFESEWVNVFALTAEAPELRDDLLTLVSMVRLGVPGPTSLADQLGARALELGLPVDRPNDLVQVGLTFLQEQFGLTVGLAAQDEVVRSVVARTDRLLRAGNLPDALSMFSNLGQPVAAGFDDWRAQAELSAAARRTVDRLQTISRARLSDRAKNVASSASN